MRLFFELFPIRFYYYFDDFRIRKALSDSLILFLWIESLSNGILQLVQAALLGPSRTERIFSTLKSYFRKI